MFIPDLMRRLLPFLLLTSLACNFVTARWATPTGVAPTTPTRLPTRVAPAATSTPWRATPTPAKGVYVLRPDQVFLRPDPLLYTGDVVSFILDADDAPASWQEARVRVFHRGTQIAEGQIGRFGIGERARATLIWAWETRDLTGEQELVFSVTPANDRSAGGAATLTMTVNLHASNERPQPEPLARWAQTESACCIFHYLTGTAAARDIEQIKTDADRAFERVRSVLGVTQEKKVVFNMLSRLLGHGGFASDEISLTYIDRNPVGNRLGNIFTHEGTHVLDRQLARAKPILLTEGLAVYVAGGHFKPEDLELRAAALLKWGRYLPLAELADNFYPSQHEIGYLEGGAFINYLVGRYGLDQFKKFYGSFQNASSDSQMLNAALRRTYGQTLAELEAEMLAKLRALDVPAEQVDDLRLTVELFDTLRRYQQLNDPAAYFLTTWLPNGTEARRRQIVADFVRHPTAPENIALEAMLADANRALEQGEFDTTEALLTSVNRVLDAHNLFFDPLAAQYLRAVTQLQAAGYEAQTINLDAGVATAIKDWPKVETWQMENDQWRIANGRVLANPITRNP